MSTTQKDWRSALLQPDEPLQQVIDIINRAGFQIGLVVDPQGCLLGTVTDGDVRRSLLRGRDMTTAAHAIMNGKPLVVPPDMGRDSVLRLMRANKIHQVPVVDEDGSVVGLHIWDDVLSPAVRSDTIVIMAGGFGRRLLPYTEDCPKPMLPVAGKPMLQHIIERAIDEGFSKFVIAVHYLGHVIRDHFKDGSALGVEISYLQEDEPLGTAGAISLLDPVPQRPIIVTNGDVLSDIRYGELLDFHLQNKAEATVAVRQFEWQHPFGVVRTEGLNIVGFEEKPVYRSCVNAGIYVLNPGSLALLPKGEPCDMVTLFKRVQKAGKQAIAYPMHEPWLDVGRAEDLARANDL